MKKVKRYSGEDGESDVKDEPFESGFTPTEDLNPKEKKQSFGEAFKAARSSGESTFTWNGKSYGTKLASETKPAAKPTPKVEAPKAETKPAPKAASKPYNESDSFETKVAKLKSSKPYNEDDSFETKVAKLKGKTAEAPKAVSKPKADKEDPVAAAKAMREAIAGPDKNLPVVPGKPARSYDKSPNRSYKAGGAIKKMAKGGSASSRGDGCAQRGKTKGKMC
jgi:hypothetical protein